MNAEEAGWGNEQVVRGMQAQAVKESHTGKKKLQNQKGEKEKKEQDLTITCTLGRSFMSYWNCLFVLVCSD